MSFFFLNVFFFFKPRFCPDSDEHTRYLLYTFKYTSVKTAWLFLHSFWGVASSGVRHLFGLFNPLESRMQVCILFRQVRERWGSTEGANSPEPLWASTCSLRSEFVTRFCVAPRCLGWRAFVCVRISALLLRMRGLFDLHWRFTTKLRLINYPNSKKWHTLIWINRKTTANGIGAKAQSHIHLFENKELNCLKLKWALNLTLV